MTVAEPHPFTTDGYVHAHDLATVRCVVCGRVMAKHVVESDTSSNARPDTDQPVTNWPEGDGHVGV